MLASGIGGRIQIFDFCNRRFYTSSMAKDTIHDAVKHALIKDGWTITHDPYRIEYAEISVSADLGAERTIAAERDTKKIVVEIKSFIGRSAVQDLKLALGQYLLYRGLLEVTEPERMLYLAVDLRAYAEVFDQKAAQMLAQRYELPFLLSMSRMRRL